MASSPSWLPTVAEALGPPSDVRPLAGSVWRCVAGGRDVVVKTGGGVVDEAAGLADLAATCGGPPVADVLVATDEVLVTGFIPSGRRSPAGERELGRALATLHRGAWPVWGGGSSWVGNCPVDAGPRPDAVAFYGDRLIDLAARCRLDALIRPVVDQLTDLLAPGPPALVHGDLWWGNVIWATDDRPRIIDPSTHGGHPEEDLAMLALFGPVSADLLGAYQSVNPLAPGWERRVGLYQLIPLLVHTALFGPGGYRSAVQEIARDLTG